MKTPVLCCCLMLILSYSTPLANAKFIDVNECALYKPCRNGETCSNIDGGYTCTCANGWEGDDCEIDVNECTQRNPCQHGGTCLNTWGSYTCVCPMGWTGKDCTSDVNECFNDPCVNGGTCINTYGSYYCRCPFGWEGFNCMEERLRSKNKQRNYASHRIHFGSN